MSIEPTKLSPWTLPRSSACADDVFDQAIVFHAFTDMRDCEVVTFAVSLIRDRHRPRRTTGTSFKHVAGPRQRRGAGRLAEVTG